MTKYDKTAQQVAQRHYVLSSDLREVIFFPTRMKG